MCLDVFSDTLCLDYTFEVCESAPIKLFLNNDNEIRGRFHQHFYMQLWGAQILKAQKILMTQTQFLRFRDLRLTAARRMLMKLTPSANIINILSVDFAPEDLHWSYFGSAKSIQYKVWHNL